MGVIRAAGGTQVRPGAPKRSAHAPSAASVAGRRLFGCGPGSRPGAPAGDRSGRVSRGTDPTSAVCSPHAESEDSSQVINVPESLRRTWTVTRILIVSGGRAAELLGLSLEKFLARASREGIAVLDQSAEELEEDLRNA